MQRAQAAYATMHDCDLTSAAVASARLYRASLEAAVLKEANLDEAVLTGARLVQADLDGASLVRARLGGADLSRSSLRRSRCAHAQLSRAVLREADVSEADFTHADLSDVGLTAATLVGVNFSMATLDGAIADDDAWSDAVGKQDGIVPPVSAVSLLGRWDLPLRLSYGFRSDGASIDDLPLAEGGQAARRVRSVLHARTPSDAKPPHPRARPPREAERDAGYCWVWYGTDRSPVYQHHVLKGYSGRRAKDVHYGAVVVRTPRGHEIGSVGRNWWRRLWSGIDDRLIEGELTPLSADQFWSAVAQFSSASAEFERSSLVYIHGSNVTFSAAVLRAAQIGFDLKVRGAVGLFCWPSAGRIQDYPVDEATIEASEPAITQFFVGFVERSGSARVSVIAHSMGNRALLRSAARIVGDAGRATRIKFFRCVLAAADVDQDHFQNLALAYADVAARTTLYISDRDVALRASRWLHTYPRVGFAPPVLVFPGIDSVHVADVDLTLLGHGYVAACRSVLYDMHAVLHQNTAPDDRVGLRRGPCEGAAVYWEISR